jgi:tetratricopeptide (TPR) repeat protein
LVDDQVIAVLPFRVAGAEPSLHYLREGMLDLLSARLASGNGVRSVDSRTVLAAWRREGGDDRTDPSEDASRAIASRIGAGQVLMGDIVGGAKQITVHGALVSAVNGKRTDASVTGPTDSLQSLVDRMTAELLTRRAGETGRLANLAGTSLTALRAYLDGQANYRRGRWEAAGQSFNAALDADTTFGLAALGVIQASRWGSGTRDVMRANLVAWMHRDQFSPRDRALLVVLLGANFPRPQSAGERGAAAQRYRDLAPDSPDAWYQVGDWNYHFGVGSGIADAARRSVNAFEKSLELDSTFTPSLEHLPDLYAITGDSVKLRRSIALLVKTDSGNTLAGQRMIAAADLGDSTEVRALRADIPRMRPSALFEIMYAARVGRLGIDDGIRSLQVLRSTATTAFDRSQADLSDMVFESDLGHPGKAVEALGRYGTESANAQHVLGALFWDWDTAGVGGMTRALEEDARSSVSGSFSDRLRAVADLSTIGEVYASRGDAKALSRTIDDLRAINPGNDGTGIGQTRDRYQIVLEAQLAALTHRSDLRTVLTRLDSVLVSEPQGQLVTIGNLVAGRGWEAAGDLPRAVAALRRTNSLSGLSSPLTYYSTLLREQGRLGALAGDRDLAIRSYRQYLALRRDADAALRPQVEEVRASLQRLESQRAR